MCWIAGSGASVTAPSVRAPATRSRAASWQNRNAWVVGETLIERQHPVDAVCLHNGQVQTVASG